ncbi:MAG: hypothetical protein WC326_03395 [Candidatus Delongbacteria bacterium]
MKDITQRRPSLHWAASGDSGVAILLLTAILSMVALSIATSHFMQNRSHRFQLMRERAQVYARYTAEYAVAVHGLPRFMRNPELADAGADENNLIEPDNLTDIMDAAYMEGNSAHTFRFNYHDLKMDKVFDVSSSKPYYFVSAQGEVTWRDDRGRDHSVMHRSAVGVTFGDFSRFMYFSNGEIGPEGNPVRFGVGERIYGRVHINGAAEMSPAGNPIFYGLFSQTEPAVINLLEGQYPAVFQGGWIIPYQRIAWPPDRAIEQIKEQRQPSHTYEDKILLDGGSEHPVTTYLVFDRSRYHVAQYIADSLGPGGDTLFVLGGGLDWQTKYLPTGAGRELIYVKGVCRLEGIVRGKVTVLSSDSMFIMDNIITEDTVLGPCPGDPPAENTPFGMVPLGSPNRIGLACEKDILVAATLQNGFANGMMTPVLECGQDFEPGRLRDSNIGNPCGQGRRDVIITAAIFAVGCSFGAEFWKTTAWNASVPTPAPQVEGCEGLSNTNVTVWDSAPGGARPDCIGAPDLDDRRGTIHICGSIVQTHRGFIIRNPVGPWGNAWIGYQQKNYRYDENYLSGGPPVWFRVTYDSGAQDVATEMVVPDYDRWRSLRQTELNE